MNLLSILAAVLIFGIIITVHEFGHFIVAKACKVKVSEFAIGMGPAIFKKQKGETKYALRLLPIGGYCAMDEDVTSDDTSAFCNKKVWQRLLIILAGAFMNLLLGFVVMIIVTATGESLVTTQISSFMEGAVSNQTGLQEGDKIIRVNGTRVYVDTDVSYQFQIDKDRIFDMIVLRNGEKVELEGVRFPEVTTEDGTISMQVDFFVEAQNKNVGTVISYSAGKTVSVARLIWMTLFDMIKGNVRINDLSGPVGIVGTIGTVIESGGVNVGAMIQSLLMLVVFITVNVGIFNLIPFPALDGARAVFLIIEGIRGKKIKPEHEGMVHFIGLALLMLLMLVVSFNDVLKIFK